MVLDSNPVAVSKTLDIVPVSSKEFYDIQTSTECRLTLKRVCDMTRTHCRGLVFAVLLTDFSKAFNCLSNELLAVKLNAYGLKTLGMRLIYDYLTRNTKQRTKIGGHYGSWKELLCSVPQKSILGTVAKYLSL